MSSARIVAGDIVFLPVGSVYLPMRAQDLRTHTTEKPYLIRVERVWPSLTRGASALFWTANGVEMYAFSTYVEIPSALELLLFFGSGGTLWNDEVSIKR